MLEKKASPKSKIRLPFWQIHSCFVLQFLLKLYEKEKTYFRLLKALFRSKFFSFLVIFRCFDTLISEECMR